MTTETRVKQCLKKFGFEKFRSDLQEKAILAIINGKSDVFISLPTGAGKSLCYQFPAVYKEDGLSLVISPLLALIQDQVNALNDKQIVARTLNSTLSQQEKKLVLGDLMQRQPTTRLLYITPELAATQSFLSIIKKVHQRQLVNYLIIDEAHCVSQWGHDYRPDYLKLGTLHDELKNVPCIAVTATASQQVIEDIYSLLHLKQPVLEFKSSVFRPNLFYDVQFKELLDDPFVNLCEFIEQTRRSTDIPFVSGIVYCRTRNSCSELAEKLTQTKKHGTVKAYHAGLTSEKRTQIQSEWMEGLTSIICATISFGMGIDKGDVRFVVHWDLAKSISGYYQESGRAGRDGNRSNCRMYYSARERDTQLFLINQEVTDKKISDEQKASMLNGFNALVQYCEEAKCRHLVICNYFGDMLIKPCENMCDVCTQRDLVSANLQNLKKKKVDETNNRRSTNRIMFRNEGSEEQYEGGRVANRRDEREYRNTDDDYQRDDNNETAKTATKLVHDELKRRGAALENKPKAWTAVSANCPLIDPSNRKMPNVTIQLREHVCRKLKEALVENVEKHFTQDEAQQLAQESTCLDKAVWLEHQVFLATKSEPMYKMKYMSKCNEITKATKNNASLYIVDCVSTSATNESNSPPTPSKRKFSETDVLEPEAKILKPNGHSDIEPQAQESAIQPSLSPTNTENKSPNRERSSSSSSSSSSSRSSSSSSSSSSSASSSSSGSSRASLPKPKTASNNEPAKTPILKQPNGERKKSKLLHQSLTNAKSQSPTTRHRRSSLPVPSNPFDVKAKQARGTLKTCLESMSNFLHQKLNEQPSAALTIQSPSEEPISLQGTSSPSFLNDQEQQILNTNLQRQTSLDDRIRSLLNTNPHGNKKSDNHETKDPPAVKTRKSLPLPPGTSNTNAEQKQSSSSSSKKRSTSLGTAKSSSKKLSSSTNHKRLSSTTASSSNRKSSSSSSKKARDSKLPVNIKTISEVVVDVLNPFYQANRFSSKELFKTLAKRISQHLASKEFSNIDAVRMDAKSLIKPAFRHKHSKILTHADLDRIVPS